MDGLSSTATKDAEKARDGFLYLVESLFPRIYRVLRHRALQGTARRDVVARQYITGVVGMVQTCALKMYQEPYIQSANCGCLSKLNYFTKLIYLPAVS